MLDMNQTYTVDGVARPYRAVQFDKYRTDRVYKDAVSGLSSHLVRDHSTKNGRVRHLQQLNQQVEVTRNGVTSIENVTVNITVDAPEDSPEATLIPLIEGACGIVTTEAELPRFLSLES